MTTATRRRPALFVVLVLAALAELAFTIVAKSQERVVLAGNHPVANVQGWQPAALDLQLHVMAVLALRHTGQLQTLKGRLQQPDSPSYHNWLSSAEFARQFGPTASQLSAVTGWLESSRFTIQSADRATREVRFSGSVNQVQQALGTRVVSNGLEFANSADPQIPAGLAGTIVAFFGLNNLSRDAPARSALAQDPAMPSPMATIAGSTQIHFSPQDVWLFYNEPDPTAAGANGGTTKNDCIALLENATLLDVPSSSSPAPSIVDVFSNQFGLPPASIQVFPTDQSVAQSPPSDNEPQLDAEWAHAVAPNTPIYLYVATIPNSTTTAFDTLSLAVSQNTCGVISSSIDNEGDECPDFAQIQAYAQTDAQAVVQGQTLFHSAGDYGSFYPCGQPTSTTGESGIQPSIEESSASSDVTVAGGTQFNPVYDANGNNTSVLTPGFEQVWQTPVPLSPVPTPAPAPQKGTSGGGISVVFPAPSWQAAIVPYGLTQPLTMRGVPDVSIAASSNEPGYWIATTTTISCPNSPTPTCFIGDGGTSASSPIWAGISRLIANRLKTPRLGNINRKLYELAAVESLALVDVSQPGNNCSYDNCSAYPGYQVGPGYDLGTGLGSPNIEELVAIFQPGPTPTPTRTPAASPSPTRTATVTSTPSQRPTPILPTPSSVSRAEASGSGTIADGVRGQRVPGGSLRLGNISNFPEIVTSVTVELSHPDLFSKLIMSGSVNGAQGQGAATGTLSRDTIFTFDPPLILTPSSVAELKLDGTLSSSAARANTGISYAGMWPRHLQPGALPIDIPVGLLGFGIIGMQAGWRRRALIIVTLLIVAGFSQLGCNGSSDGHVPVCSQQQVPAGGVNITNAQGEVVVQGLPATMSTIRLVS